MKAQELYDDKTRNAIIKDLLKKTPKAELGHDNENMTFDIDYKYCDRYNKYRNLQQCSKEYWGYTWQQLIKCGLHSDNGVQTAVEAQAAAEGKEISYKAKGRRTNRIEDRIGRRLWKLVRSGAVPGIYRVTRSYDTVGAVAADSLSHAEQIASVTYGALFPAHRAPRLQWAGPVSRELLLEEITRAQRGNFDRRIEDARSKYEKTLVEIEKDREEQSYIQLVGLNIAETIEESSAGLLTA